ncbi:MAG: hypothetical protein V3U74_05885 [Thermodesulfobacteriota bacterium]
MRGSLSAIIFMLLLVFPAALYSQDGDEENPHKEMTEDQFVCLECHTKVPKETESSPDYFLVDLPSENCLGCHSEMPHPGVREHEGKEASPLPGDENGKVACFSCHDPHPGGVLKGRVVYKAELDERNKRFIKFVVLPDVEKTVGKTVSSGENEYVRLRHPVSKNELCNRCHESLPKTNFRGKVLWDKFIRLYSY